MRSGAYAYRDRRNRKRDFRRLWITRINAAARQEGMSYSELIHGLNEAGVEVNRKMLADIAVHDPERSADLPSAPGRRRPPSRRQPDARSPGRSARRSRPFSFLRPTSSNVITSPHNEKLKLIRKLARAQAPRARGPVRRRGRGPARGRRAPPGASRSSCSRPPARASAGRRSSRRCSTRVSTLGSGTRVIGVWRQRWAEQAERALRLPARRRRPRQRRHDRSAPRTRWSAARSCSGPDCADPYGAEGGAGEHGRRSSRSRSCAAAIDATARAAGRRWSRTAASRSRRSIEAGDASASAPSARGCPRRRSRRCDVDGDDPAARRAPSRSTSRRRRRSRCSGYRRSPRGRPTS